MVPVLSTQGYPRAIRSQSPSYYWGGTFSAMIWQRRASAKVIKRYDLLESSRSRPRLLKSHWAQDYRLGWYSWRRDEPSGMIRRPMIPTIRLTAWTISDSSWTTTASRLNWLMWSRSPLQSLSLDQRPQKLPRHECVLCSFWPHQLHLSIATHRLLARPPARPHPHRSISSLKTNQIILRQLIDK